MNQFEKRKAKEKSMVDTIVEKVPELAEIAPAYTQTGYVVYSEDGGANYKVAEIEYNPASTEARVKDTSKITRLVALQHAAQQQALGILKKKS